MLKGVVVFALTTLCLTFSTATWGQSFFAACGFPSEAAEAWRDFFPSGDAATCPGLCQAWERSCQGTARVAKQCDLGIVAQLSALVRAECRTEPTPAERQECQRSFQEAAAFLKALIKEDAEAASMFCADAQQRNDCLAACQS